MAGQRRSIEGRSTLAMVLILGVFVTWCLPIQAQNEIPSPQEDNVIGIQFGINGEQVPFVKPFITQLFSDIGLSCVEGGQPQLSAFADGPCCEAAVGDVVAHFCPGNVVCAVCPETTRGQPSPVTHDGNQELLDELFDALVENAQLGADLSARMKFEEERHELTEAVLASAIENAELRAEVEIAQHRVELQEQVMKTMAENVRLHAQIELAEQRQQYVGQLATEKVENEKLKLQLAKLQIERGAAEYAKLKLAKAKHKGHAKKKGKVAKAKKKSDETIRTAKRPNAKDKDAK